MPKLLCGLRRNFDEKIWPGAARLWAAVPALWLPAALFLSGCLSPPWRGDYQRLEQEMRHRAAPAPDEPPAAPGPAAESDLEASLSGPLDLDALLQAAVRRNPRLRASLERTRAALEEVKRAGALDDPSFKFEAWAVPLRHPAAFDRGDTNMFGLMQNFPFPGKLGLRAEAAWRDAEATFQMVRQEEFDLILHLKNAYYAYFSLSKELDFHFEHVKILEEFESIANEKFKRGIISQEDVLKAQVELITLHNEVFAIEQQLGSQRAAINILLNRPVNAPLGKPVELSPTAAPLDLKEMQDRALEARPEARGARLKLLSSQTGLKLAERDAWLPDFSVGLDYWQMPREDDAWGGVFSLNIPWLTGKRLAEVRKLEHAARADEIGLEAVRNQILYEVRDAYLRVEAARKSVLLFKGELIPKSQQSVDVSRSNYEKDRTTFLNLLEAERSLRDVKIKYHQAIAAHETAMADLERAAGAVLKK